MQPQIVESGQGQDYDWANDHIFVKTTLNLTDGRVTVVEDTLKPGFHLARHHHKKLTEIFYILEGEIEFIFDNATVISTPGMTINIPPALWHEVKCERGGKLLTIFSPGGFDKYLTELASLNDEQFSDAAFTASLAQKYDIWME